MKYKIGDRVKIRDDLIPGEYYGEDIFSSGMHQYAGKIATIIGIDTKSYISYIIDLDNGDWSWTDEMFKKKINELDYFQEQLDESFAELIRKHQFLQKELIRLQKKYNKNDV